MVEETFEPGATVGLVLERGPTGIGPDYHFLSDIIAGGFIGVSTGWIAVAI